MFQFHDDVAVESFVLGTERLEERFPFFTLGRLSFQSHRHLACSLYAGLGAVQILLSTKPLQTLRLQLDYCLSDGSDGKGLVGVV